jgi:hypothetical protein
MTAPQLFVVGTKLIGLYFLAVSLPILLAMAVGLPFSDLWGQTDGSPFKLYIAISIFGLLVMVVFGWVLIKSSGVFLRNIFVEEPDLSESRIKDTFTIGVKLFGIYLAMSEFLRCTRLLSNFSMVSSFLSVYGGIAASIGMATNFIPSLVSVVVGLLLFFRGELLSDWAFAERSPVTDNGGNA